MVIRWLVGALALLAVALLVGVIALRGVFRAGQDAAGDRALASPEAPASQAARSVGALSRTLQAQGAALLRGDLRGWLAPIDPSNTALTSKFRELYDSLHGLGVTGWNPVTYADPAPARTGDQHPQRVLFGYCFSTGACPAPAFFAERVAALPATVSYRVDAGQQVIITAVDTSEDGHPLVGGGELVAVRGERVMVVGPSSLAGRLREMLPRADRAARAADRYAQWGNRPAQYTIYLAGSREWSSWFDGAGAHSGEKIDGYARRSSQTSSDVVIDVSHPVRDIDVLLRHELGHVATLIGADYPNSGEIWVIEGLAEYVAATGFDPAAYAGRIEQTRQYLRTGKWSGRIDTGWKLIDNGGAGAYGIAYLTMRYLADRFGEKALMTFAELHLRHSVPLSEAARRAFGSPWSALEPDCTAYVRRVAG